MAIKNKKRGFALLVAVIFMSVMLTFGLALSSMAYKQQLLASGAVASQYAFYVADAALECLLYADQQQDLFVYPVSAPSVAPILSCVGSPVYGIPTFSYSASNFIVTTRLSMDSGKHCADVTIYKPAPNTGTTYLFSQGYDVSCATVASPNGTRFVARGLSAEY